jgi:hypothetical protein
LLIAVSALLLPGWRPQFPYTSTAPARPFAVEGSMEQHRDTNSSEYHM